MERMVYGCMGIFVYPLSLLPSGRKARHPPVHQKTSRSQSTEIKNWCIIQPAEVEMQVQNGEKVGGVRDALMGIKHGHRKCL